MYCSNPFYQREPPPSSNPLALFMSTRPHYDKNDPRPKYIIGLLFFSGSRNYIRSIIRTSLYFLVRWRWPAKRTEIGRLGVYGFAGQKKFCIFIIMYKEEYSTFFILQKQDLFLQVVRGSKERDFFVRTIAKCQNNHIVSEQNGVNLYFLSQK